MENPQLSTLSLFIEASKPTEVPIPDSHQHPLAAQVLHNLQYQHDWSSLQFHYKSPIDGRPLQKILISGLPPHRIYVHPDEQIEMLKQNATEKDITVEREWVLPTHLREKWSLRKFAEVFDGIDEGPPIDHRRKVERRHNDEAKEIKNRRGGKRLLLATVGDDSTVVYYIVHDGIVKPRQN